MRALQLFELPLNDLILTRNGIKLVLYYLLDSNRLEQVSTTPEFSDLIESATSSQKDKPTG